jgi:hypothetical protein
MKPDAVPEPRVMLPPAVLDHVTAEYGAARVVLEYGAGGSTVLAASLGARVFAVESDPAWIGNVDRWLAANGLQNRVTLHHADIGRTARWGRPKKARRRHWARYLRYPRSVWDRPDFEYPDTILVDGRFRVASFLCAMTRIRRPTRLLFDDYVTRPDYHAVERFQRPALIVDRMAVFDLEPRRLTAREWIETLPQRLDHE